METIRQFLEDYPEIGLLISLTFIAIAIYLAYISIKMNNKANRPLSNAEDIEAYLAKESKEPEKPVYSIQLKKDAKNWWNGLGYDAKLSYMRQCNYNGIIRDLRVNDIYYIFSVINPDSSTEWKQ